MVLMSYYHDYRMEKIFQALEQPKTIESLQLSESFITDLFLKIVAGYGTIKTSTINEITGIHWDILEKILPELEKVVFAPRWVADFYFQAWNTV